MENKGIVVFALGTLAVELFQLILVILRFCQMITWKWIWIFAPTWIGWGLELIVALILFIIILIHD